MSDTTDPEPTRESLPPFTAPEEPLGRSPREYLSNLKYDIPSSVVVFLVALPLCLGIAVASDAPPLAGLLTGIVGGVVVAWASGSQLAVSGPAAGLTSIVSAAILELEYDGFLLAVVLAGGMQIVLGALRAGIFAYYFPSAVIKGMLAGIGLILIWKQIPHAVGWDADYEGDLTFFQPDDQNTLSELWEAAQHTNAGAIFISVLGLVILVVMDRVPALKRLRLLPAPLLVVVLGVVLNAVYAAAAPDWHLGASHLVELPTGGTAELLGALQTPAFGRIADVAVWTTAATIAAVASIETLLCIEAIDKLDPYKRATPTNRELAAQGVGNIIAGMLGGLPITAVIVRGSANIQAGGRTKMSAFLHGLLLLAAVIALPWLMNLIPLAALAAVLLYVGYKLTRGRLWRFMLSQDVSQWMPFVVTIAGVFFLNLLEGVGIGMAVAAFFILRANLQTPYFIHHREAHETGGRPRVRIELSENVSFLNRASVSKVLHEMPEDSIVEIDGTQSQYVHPDVLELIHEFRQVAPTRGIEVALTDVPEYRKGP